MNSSLYFAQSTPTANTATINSPRQSYRLNICAASNNNATHANVIFNFVYMFDLEMPCIYVIIEGLMED